MSELLQGCTGQVAVGPVQLLMALDVSLARAVRPVTFRKNHELLIQV